LAVAALAAAALAAAALTSPPAARARLRATAASIATERRVRDSTAAYREKRKKERKKRM
jgi:hypothetical protein